ncbi:hypothetical protein H2248_003967 [Termitomyces sp. 'cryptogamus']|nr:hypothetical protein H2248_003967 [Termitomyces sp. 'cryptogamus']
MFLYYHKMFMNRLLELFRFFRVNLFRSAWKPSSPLRRLIDNFPPSHQHGTIKDFSNSNFERISLDELVEEENFDGYQAEWYYPVRIGEVISSQYQVVGKLGYGRTSTVWLARDLKEGRYVCLKICVLSSILEEYNLQELAAYRRLEQGPENHRGRETIRPLLNEFIITGPDGEHQCFVHPPLWGNIGNFLRLNPDTDRLFPPILAFMLKRLFLALDYAQECQVIHTDISPSNVMLNITDPTSLEKFEQAELENPSPRKEINGRFIYLSREIEYPNNACGVPIICDFGHAVWGGEKHVNDAQPDKYRSPEVILNVPWCYEVDVWSIACLIWDIFEDASLFNGFDDEYHTYRGRTHLAEMIAIMGPPPPEFLARGSLASKFFSPEGKFIGGVEIPPLTLNDVETTLTFWEKYEGERDLFLQFMRKMLQWDPKNRQTPKQLLEDEWIGKHCPD